MVTSSTSPCQSDDVSASEWGVDDQGRRASARPTFWTSDVRVEKAWGKRKSLLRGERGGSKGAEIRWMMPVPGGVVSLRQRRRDQKTGERTVLGLDREGTLVRVEVELEGGVREGVENPSRVNVDSERLGAVVAREKRGRERRVVRERPSRLDGVKRVV